MDTTNLVAWLPFDESTTQDLCGNTWTATGDVSFSTTVKKFGTASVHLPNGARLVANNIINLNADKWTFDCWAYLVSSSSDEGYFALSARTDGARYGIINSNDGIWIAKKGGGSWQAKNENLLFPSVKNQWVHLAIVKSGSTVIFYQDGVSVWSFTTSALDNNGAFILGGNYYGYDTDIYFDEVRFFDGVALWTENFTPPTAANYAFVEVQRVKIKPEVFASWIPTGEINFKPEIFATLIGEDIICEFNADLRRKLVNTNDFNADLKRTLVVSETFSADLRRSLTNKVNFSFDLRRKIINRIEFSVDLKRTIIAPVDFTVDLRRSLVNTVDFTFDLHAHIYWKWLTRILPESSFLDSKMYASAEALDVQITKLYQSIREVLHLPRLDELSGTILDLLAEQFHVDYYDAINFSDEEKRNLIRQSIAWHRLKGTPAAVEMVLQDAFKDLRIDEWFTYGGEPYFFRLWTKGYISTPERFKSFWLMFMDAKNVRSQLEMVTIDHSHDEPIQLYTGVAKVTSGLKIIDLPKHDDAKINLHTGVAIVNVGQKIIDLPKHNDIHTKIYSGVYQIHTGTIFIGMKRNPF